jgi:hypothetical protein
MKNEVKLALVLIVSLIVGLAASCASTGQSLTDSEGGNAINKLIEGNKKIEKAVVFGYKSIENAVVSGYKFIENGVVNGYKAIEKKFVETFLTSDEGLHKE